MKFDRTNMRKLDTIGDGDIHDHFKVNNDNVQVLDLFSQEDDGATITVATISHELYEEYWHANADFDFRSNKFQYSNVKDVGAHNDAERLEDYSLEDELYTVVVPLDFLTPEVVNIAIKQLNKEYSKNFELEEVQTDHEAGDLFQ